MPVAAAECPVRAVEVLVASVDAGRTPRRRNEGWSCPRNQNPKRLRPKKASNQKPKTEPLTLLWWQLLIGEFESAHLAARAHDLAVAQAYGRFWRQGTHSRQAQLPPPPCHGPAVLPASPCSSLLSSLLLLAFLPPPPCFPPEGCRWLSAWSVRECLCGLGGLRSEGRPSRINEFSQELCHENSVVLCFGVDGH